MERYFRPAARFIILNKENQLLIARHKRHWAIPGGGIDIGETIPQALIRESKEELNITAEFDQIIFIQDYLDDRDGESIHALEYFCTITNNDDFENVLETWEEGSHAFELQEIQWFDIDNLPSDLMPKAFPNVLQEYLKNKEGFKTQYISGIE